jgi:hypothetical protein
MSQENFEVIRRAIEHLSDTRELAPECYQPGGLAGSALTSVVVRSCVGRPNRRVKNRLMGIVLGLRGTHRVRHEVSST